LPERFRGGCSFGGEVSPALSRLVSDIPWMTLSASQVKRRSRKDLTNVYSAYGKKRANLPFTSQPQRSAAEIEIGMMVTTNYAAYTGLAIAICLITVLVMIQTLAYFEQRAKNRRLSQQRQAALSRYKYNDGTDRTS